MEAIQGARQRTGTVGRTASAVITKGVWLTWIAGIGLGIGVVLAVIADGIAKFVSGTEKASTAIERIAAATVVLIVFSLALTIALWWVEFILMSIVGGIRLLCGEEFDDPEKPYFGKLTQWDIWGAIIGGLIELGIYMHFWHPGVFV